MNNDPNSVTCEVLEGFFAGSAQRLIAMKTALSAAEAERDKAIRLSGAYRAERDEAVRVARTLHAARDAGQRVSAELYRAERDRARAEIERMNAALRKIVAVAETLKV